MILTELSVLIELKTFQGFIKVYSIMILLYQRFSSYIYISRDRFGLQTFPESLKKVGTQIIDYFFEWPKQS